MDQINIQEYYIHQAPMLGSGSKFSCMKNDEDCEDDRPIASPSLGRSLQPSPATSPYNSHEVTPNVSPSNVGLDLFNDTDDYEMDDELAKIMRREARRKRVEDNQKRREDHKMRQLQRKIDSAERAEREARADLGPIRQFFISSADAIQRSHNAQSPLYRPKPRIVK